jgi:hypothetical protein
MTDEGERRDLVALCAAVARLSATDDLETVLAARLALYHHLLDDGWVPPARVAVLLALRDVLLDVDLETLLTFR